jgi:hypothetical protein
MEYVSRTPAPGEIATDYALLGGEHSDRSRRLFTAGLVLVAACLIALVYTAKTSDPLHLFQGLVIFILAVLPSLLWARNGGSRFPTFETIMLLCANAYAMPLINGKEQLAEYDAAVISKAGWAVLLYLATANLVYHATRGVPGRSSFWREPLISDQVERKIVYGLLISTTYIILSEFTSLVPQDLIGPLRAIFYGVGILCTFVGSQRWGRGLMTAGEKTVLVVTLATQLLVMSVGLILISSIGLLGIAILGYLSGGKRIPWFVVISGFIVIGILHTGKTRMREKYWDGFHASPTFTELPAYFAEWVDYGTQPTSGDKTVSQKVLERTSLIHMLCLVMTYTPERQDYLYGRSYSHVLPQLIPRFFWNAKPRSHIATYELAIYYGLQREEDTASTTIAFGLLTEAYANFGMAGAILLGAFWGFVLKKLQIWSTFSPMFSFAGLFMILLTAWSFNSELTMAAWVSSFQQAAVMVLGLPLLVRSLLGGGG